MQGVWFLALSVAFAVPWFVMLAHAIKQSRATAKMLSDVWFEGYRKGFEEGKSRR